MPRCPRTGDSPTTTNRTHQALAVAAVLILSVVLWACGSDSATESSTTTSSSPAPTTTTMPATTTMPTSTTTVVVEVAETDFVNVNDMTPVRGFVVDNLLGDLDATLEVANSPDGGSYPIGSVIQLVPTEAMIKREPGFSPETNDWEFFELDVSPEGTTIRVRGGDEVVNQFGGSCATCHALAEPQWDFVCEQDHGCEALPFTSEQFAAFRELDPRPRQP